MIVHVKKFIPEVELEEHNLMTLDLDMTQELKSASRTSAFAARGTNDIAPILDEDEDFDDFDASAYVERRYQ